MFRHVLIAERLPFASYAMAALLHEVDDQLLVDHVFGQLEAEVALTETAFAVMVIDIRLGDSEGLPTLALVRMLRPETKVLVTVERVSASLVQRIRELGASGCLPKSASLDEIRDALKAVLQGEEWFPAMIAPADDTGPRPEALSNAQTKVMIKLASGQSNKLIAHDLNISEATVKSHFSAIYKALGVANRSQAILALQRLEG